ncbi:hypothetical protein GBN15_07705 [Plesiomonas shigelloides]|nr:hypothetical protein GBN15_07705 [Plesiomonas shigelloides]
MREKTPQLREILISESAWEEMIRLFAPSLVHQLISYPLIFCILQNSQSIIHSWSSKRAYGRAICFYKRGYCNKLNSELISYLSKIFKHLNNKII